MTISRRTFLQKTLLAGATLVLSPGIASLISPRQLVAAPFDPFTFVMIGDSHLMGNKNPRLKIRLEAAIREINALDPQPDFVIYMGDAVHDGTPGQFQYFAETISQIKPKIYFVPGEHDWYLDMGETYRSSFIKGDVPYSFNHKGHHIVVLNGILLNDFWTSRKLTPEQRMEIAGTLNNPRQGPFRLGQEQMAWLEKDLSQIDRATPLLVFSHTPLYHYYRPWNFWVDDAAEAQGLFKSFEAVALFHGHVHHIVQNQIEQLRFYSNLSTAWPYPYPETGVPQGSPKMPRPSPANFYDGLGWSRNEAGKGNVVHRDILWTLTPPSF
ncbi:MAG: metallophosphoesterase [Nitrospirae bacterium]|nr:metallophosphoesterase [Nitrospirota bacterium]MBI3351326.1 metallophosphoesterase [Nitrospirota bacterium]